MQDKQYVFEGLTVIGSLIAAILFMMVTLDGHPVAWWLANLLGVDI